MTGQQYKDAKEVLLKVLELQPNLLGVGASSSGGGTRLAKTLWDFIDEYSKQQNEKVKG